MQWELLVGVTGAGSGSGYLIAPRLILTSAHVTGPQGSVVRVIRPGRKGSGEHAATVVWCGRAGGTSDAALVEITDPVWAPPVVRPVIWGRLVTHQPGTKCRTWGMPDFAQRQGKATDTEQPTGTLNPGDGLAGNQHILHLAEYPPTTLGESPWKGISGAAVYCGDLLTGVVATDPAHRGHAALGVVPAYVLLAQPGFREIVEQHCGPTGLEWAPVELQDLADSQSPTRTATTPATPATLLTARRAVVAFRGRTELLDELREWAVAPGMGTWLVHGVGGQGKTRLAHELATELAGGMQRWSVLWLDPAAGTAENLRVLGRVVTPLLVVVDYAESRAVQVGMLLTELAAHLGEHPVKVLLLARTVGDWWGQLKATTQAVGDILVGTRHTALAQLDVDADARHATYQATVEAIARHLPALTDTAGLDWGKAAATVLAGPYRDLGHDATVLGVQMTALADLLDTHHPASGLSWEVSLEDRILDHEHRYWQATATRDGLDSLGIAVLKDALTAGIVLAAATRRDLDHVLERVPDLTDQPRLTRSKIRDWLMSLYPGDGPGSYAGLGPDRLAEQLVGRSILDPLRDSIVETLATTLTDHEEAEHLLTVCTRAAAHPTLTPAGEQLTTWCIDHPALHPAAIRVATRVENPQPLITALDTIATTPPDTLDAVPDQTRVLAETAATQGPAVPEQGLAPVKPTARQRKTLVLMTAGAVVAVAVAAGAAAVITTRSGARPPEGITATPTMAEAEECVTTGIIDFDGRCIRADSDQLPPLSDSNIRRNVETIVTSNQDAAKAPFFYRIGLPAPIPLKRDHNQLGQLDNTQLEQMLSGAAAAQSQINAPDSTVKIQLVMADIGVDQKGWQIPFDRMESMVGDDSGNGRLLGVVTLTTSLPTTNDAAQRLKDAKITTLGPITNADDLDPWIVSMMPKVSELVTTLDEWVGRQPQQFKIVELQDRMSIDENDMYIKSLVHNFGTTEHIKNNMLEVPPIGFDGATLVPGGQSNNYQNVCESGANTLVYEGRDADLSKLIDWLRSCTDRPSTILTIAASLSSADKNESLLKKLGISVVYATPVDPSTASGDGWNSYRTSLERLLGEPGTALPAEAPSAYGCLTSDAVLSLTAAIRKARIAGAPNRRNVSTQLGNINTGPDADGSVVPGCSGPIAFGFVGGKPLSRLDPPKTIVVQPKRVPGS